MKPLGSSRDKYFEVDSDQVRKLGCLKLQLLESQGTCGRLEFSFQRVDSSVTSWPSSLIINLDLVGMIIGGLSARDIDNATTK